MTVIGWIERFCNHVIHSIEYQIWLVMMRIPYQMNRNKNNRNKPTGIIWTEVNQCIEVLFKLNYKREWEIILIWYGYLSSSLHISIIRMGDHPSMFVWNKEHLKQNKKCNREMALKSYSLCFLFDLCFPLCLSMDIPSLFSFWIASVYKYKHFAMVTTKQSTNPKIFVKRRNNSHM